MQIKHDIVDSNEGVVLVMVLIVLVATIIIGIMLSRSSFFEAKIAGNERASKNDFYATEGASDYLISDFDRIMSPLAAPVKDVALDLAYTLPSTNPIGSASLTLTYIRTGTPHEGSENSVKNTYVNYYLIDSALNQQSIRVGVWKAFPKAE